VAPHATRAGLFAFRNGRYAVPDRDGPGRDDSDAGGHISTEPRINERIRVPEVRLVGPSGEQVGIVSITDALRLAQEADLDLVEVAPTARPPVCKLMDYGKFKYESALKARESRKNQAQTVIKEIKIRPKIDPHDYGTKKGHVERFLRQGDKVKVTIMFRGREQSRPELGYKLLQRLAGDVEELGFVESQPKQDGRNMIMVIGPLRKKADTKAVRGPDRASARAAAPSAQAGHDDAGEATTTASRSAPAPQAAARPASAQRESASSAGAEQADLSSASVGQAPVTANAQPRPVAPKPGPVSGGSSRPAAPRPAAPKPGPAGSAPKPASPRPGPAGTGATRPATPRPAPPKPGPVPAGSPRPAAPKPAAPRPSTAQSGEGSAVPSPRTRAGEAGSAAADSGG
jgi:translation initiation factor IF-3